MYIDQKYFDSWMQRLLSQFELVQKIIDRAAKNERKSASGRMRLRTTVFRFPRFARGANLGNGKQRRREFVFSAPLCCRKQFGCRIAVNRKCRAKLRKSSDAFCRSIWRTFSAGRFSGALRRCSTRFRRFSVGC